MYPENLEINEKLIVGVDDVISFIITENCSFQCAHCMREERRPNTISERVIDTVLSQVKIDGIVHLSGGEPLMQMKRVVYLIKKIYELGNKPKEINVTTNSSVCPKKFEEFITSIEGTGVDLRLLVSNDYYHKLERKRLNHGKDNILKVLKEYQKVMANHNFNVLPKDYKWMLEKYKSFEDGKGVLAIGRGKNIPGAFFFETDFDLHKSVFLRGNNIKGRIQVQPDGRITTNYDMSWKDRDEHYGQEYNILNRPLEQILRRY